MEKDLNIICGIAWKRIFQNEAKTHKRFLTQKEFEKNKAEIFMLTGARRRLNDSINKLKTNL